MGSIALSYSPFLLLMIHHGEMWLNANRNTNPNPKECTKVQQRGILLASCL